LDELTHVVVQGATRSGKSAWTYSLLAQLAAHPHVEVAGIDPTGLLLRPFGAHPRGWRAIGTTDPATRYTAAIDAVVDEMDARIAAIPPRRDTTPIGPGCPLLVVVLEEWAAVGRLQADRHATSPKGVALLTAPAQPLLRLRGPWIGGYGTYCDHIATTATATGLPYPIPGAPDTDTDSLGKAA
jgi:hypothetical protein